MEEMRQTHPPSLPTGSILDLPTLSEISCYYLAKPEGLRLGAESFVLQKYNLLILPSSSILMLARCTEVKTCQRVDHRRPRISTLYKA